MMAMTATMATTTTTTTTTTAGAKREGDISNSFASLSGTKQAPLPDRYRELKADLVRGREAEVTESWRRLLRELRRENRVVAEKGPAVIPQVSAGQLAAGQSEDVRGEILKRGVVVVKGVVPEGEARGYKGEVEEYVRKNPHTKGK